MYNLQYNPHINWYLSVSYTHLVKPLAKTVFPGAHCPLFGSALILKGVTDALMIVIAVSYTHLDVYKRQVYTQGGTVESITATDSNGTTIDISEAEKVRIAGTRCV